MSNIENALIVEDEADLRAFYDSTLKSLGFFRYIVKATDGQDALTKITNQDFCLIIVDLKMPKMSGDRFIEKLKDNYQKKGKELPSIIVASGNLDRLMLKKITEMGIHTVLTKPFRKEVFLERIRDLLNLT